MVPSMSWPSVQCNWKKWCERQYVWMINCNQWVKINEYNKMLWTWYNKDFELDSSIRVWSIKAWTSQVGRVIKFNIFSLGQNEAFLVPFPFQMQTYESTSVKT